MSPTSDRGGGGGGGGVTRSITVRSNIFMETDH